MLSHAAWPHRVSPSAAATRLAHAQSDESGIEPGLHGVATITGSLASFREERNYDTDHTDLGSDADEAELRRELLRDVSGRRKRRKEEMMR